MKIGIAIPTRNEATSLKKLLPYLDKRDYFVVISDDKSTDGTVELAKDFGAFVPYHEKKLGLGWSWKEAMVILWYSYDCDVVICMDADHNYKAIPNMLKKLRKADVVVGHEQDEWGTAREFTKWMCNKLLRLDFKHPTCGFIGFNKVVLDNIPWKHVRSRGDIFHVEMLFWARKMKATFAEQPFNVLEGVKHNYNLKRYFMWLREFFRLLRLKYFWFWRWTVLKGRLERDKKA